jgi:D-alanine-D-alanine ligase
MKDKHIAVLMGGLSAEREVSLSSGAAIVHALKERGHRVSDIDVGNDLAEQLTRLKPDVVFNALHGTYGEDGCVQGVLEILRIPYTHSGVRASAVAMHKPMAKTLFESVNIPCAKGKVVSGAELMAADVMTRPYVAKPVNEGSSVSVYIIDVAFDLASLDVASSSQWLIEEFIVGRELTVGVLDGEVTEICEIRPKSGFYDYKNKYTAGQTDYLIPADLPADDAAKIKEYTLAAHAVLGCRGVSRSDFMYGNDGRIVMLEVNTHPGFTATSLVPKLAKQKGIGFYDVLALLLSRACLDHEAELS